MCGFVGGTRRDAAYEAASDALLHRGPDARELWSDEWVTLSFLRLAIVDLDPRAMQPMFSTNRDVCIVFNGEIYGYMRLRQRLEALGHSFRTSSDTEVLLTAYLQWGDSFVEHIDGMFSIVLYDMRNRSLRLWRDRVGIKPLYYYWDSHSFLFASEIKAINAALEGSLEPRLDAYYDFLTYQSIPPPKTGYKNVFQLRPGHMLVMRAAEGCLDAEKPYWRLEVEPDHSMDISGAATKVREAIEESVRDQLIADVPVGTFLSGGVDSSIISYEAARIQPGMKAFSIGFGQAKNEIPFAQEVAAHLDVELYAQVFGESEVDMEIFRQWFDEPFADTSAFPTHAVAKLAREQVVVALSGDGGDELFGGYSRYERYREPGYRSAALYALWERGKLIFRHKSVLRRAMNLVSLFLAPPLAGYGKHMSSLSDGERALFARQFSIPSDYDDYWAWREYWRSDLPIKTRLQYLDFHRYLPDDILTKVDRATMAESLEARVPFLARNVVELAFRIPERLHFFRGPKSVLREAYRDCIPDSVFERNKVGFGMPATYLGCVGSYRPAVLLRELHGVVLPDAFEIAYASNSGVEAHAN